MAALQEIRSREGRSMREELVHTFLLFLTYWKIFYYNNAAVSLPWGAGSETAVPLPSNFWLLDRAALGAW
jgi:hypothetical protein